MPAPKAGAVAVWPRVDQAGVVGWPGEESRRSSPTGGPSAEDTTTGMGKGRVSRKTREALATRRPDSPVAAGVR